MMKQQHEYTFVPMNLNGWKYCKPVGSKHFNSHLAKRAKHIEKFDYKYVKDEKDNLKLIVRRKAI